jgi:hypothetical protein
MAMPASGTYHYTGVVPAKAVDGGFECAMTSADLPPSHLPVLTGAVRLVGRSPRLTVRDAGLNPDADDERPHVMRHAFTLRAKSLDGAQVRSATFHVESTVVERMAPGDELHLVRGHDASPGFSVLRAGRLVMAAGPLAGMPLGEGLHVRWPHELRDEILEIFRRRDPVYAAAGLTHAIFPTPLEVRAGDETALVGRLKRIVGEVEVVLSDRATGAFGIPTGVGSICLVGVGSRLGVTLTTQLLLQDDAFEMER